VIYIELFALRKSFSKSTQKGVKTGEFGEFCAGFSAITREIRRFSKTMPTTLREEDFPNNFPVPILFCRMDFPGENVFRG
jgi:hypothetical protein